MPLDAETKKSIFFYMFKHIEMDDSELVEKTAANFSISKTTVYSYLRRLVADEKIVRDDNARCKYKLKAQNYLFTYSNGDSLEEDKLFRRDIAPLISELTENVQDIWRYIFTEMMNNAIEHSQANRICCELTKTCLDTSLIISDNGIGIFKKIQNYFKAAGQEISLDDAVDALFPGKLTTAAEAHSGEGIFFSSKAADSYIIVSDNRAFYRDSFSESKYRQTITGENRIGTLVLISVYNNTSRTLKDVFSMFSDPERGFFKTQIPIASMLSTGYPVSRSEARRLCFFLNRFEEAVLDFSNVREIGQAFAHELFVVFRSNNPNIKLELINADESITNMKRRVENTK